MPKWDPNIDTLLLLGPPFALAVIVWLLVRSHRRRSVQDRQDERDDDLP